MKPVKIHFFVIILCLCVRLMAQMNDTVHLEAIEIKGVKIKYSPGSKITSIGPEQIDKVSYGSLSGVLIKNTPVYIKSYASGLSTISFRGTSPNHTQIYFDGESFNSLTLGHSNAADIPVFFFDQVQVQFGGASSLYGSGVIGGSIHLSSIPSWQKGLSAELHQDIASFRSSFSGIKFKWGNGKTESSTKIFYKTAQNNFPFKNKAFIDFETKEYLKQRQKNNALENYGFLQEFFVKAGNRGMCSLKYYYTYNWHEVQPTMSSNLYGGSFTQIYNRNQRLMGNYSFRGKNKGTFSGQVSYASDFQLYNTVDTIATNRYSGRVEYEVTIGKNGMLNLGGHYVNIIPDVYSYLEEVNENRSDFFISYVHSLFTNTKLSLNLRNANVTDYQPEWAPSAGIHQRFMLNDYYTLDWKFAASHSYKIPSFNDRYWGTWGNPDLKTEKGFNLESGLGFQTTGNSRSFNAEVTFYSMMIDNWIQWVPISPEMWSPINFKKVHSRGIEWSSSFSESIQKIQLDVHLKYSFNLATPIEVYGNDQSELNKQMPYSPAHTALLTANMEINKWRFMVDATYTGERNNSTLDRVIPDYALLNLGAGYHLLKGKSSLDFSFQVNNIFNTYYINIENYAMPGINGRLSMKYKFN